MTDAVIGHAPVLQRLYALLQQAGGTYLFFGPPSVGKRTVAFELSRHLLCSQGVATSCSCESCLRFQNGHPDFKCVGRDGRVKVAEVDALIEFSTTLPFISKRKVVVIDNAHDITWEGANRLLKLLEEPPQEMFFFLISAEPERMLPTIVSRCIRYEFGLLSPDDVMNILWKKLGYDLPKARVLGWMTAGLSMDVFAKAGVYLRYRDLVFDLVLSLKTKTVLDLLDFVDRIDRYDVESALDVLIIVLTDILLLKQGVTAISNIDRKEDLQKAAAGFDPTRLAAAVNLIGQARCGAHLNVNMNLAFKNALIKTSSLLVS